MIVKPAFNRHGKRTGTMIQATDSTLNSKVPSGPIEQKWDRYRFDLKLVNPANKRKFTIIVVGTGLAGTVGVRVLGGTRLQRPVVLSARFPAPRA